MSVSSLNQTPSQWPPSAASVTEDLISGRHSFLENSNCPGHCNQNHDSTVGHCFIIRWFNSAGPTCASAAELVWALTLKLDNVLCDC